MTKSGPETLVLLPCHSIYIGKSPADVSTLKTPLIEGPGSVESDWILADFQKEAKDYISFLYHIYTSINLLREDPENTRLVLSGGYTKSEVKKSEAASYLQVAKDRGLISQKISDFILLEEYARDSYENVLFGMMKFRKSTGVWPKSVKIVGLDFKKDRFLKEHMTTLQFPAKDTEYIGIGPIYPPITEFDGLSVEQYDAKKAAYFEDVVKSEKKYAYDPFQANPFGSKGSPLYAKKQRRDPFGRSKDIFDYYNIANELVMTEMLNLDEMYIDDAMTTYTLECKNKFPWLHRHPHHHLSLLDKI